MKDCNFCWSDFTSTGVSVVLGLLVKHYDFFWFLIFYEMFCHFSPLKINLEKFWGIGKPGVMNSKCNSDCLKTLFIFLKKVKVFFEGGTLKNSILAFSVFFSLSFSSLYPCYKSRVSLAWSNLTFELVCLYSANWLSLIWYFWDGDLDQGSRAGVKVWVLCSAAAWLCGRARPGPWCGHL